MKKVLFLLGNDFTDDNRVKIEAKALIGLGYEVTLHCVMHKDLPENENIEGIIVKRCIHVKHNAPYKKEWKKFQSEYLNSHEFQDFEVLHCHDYKMLFLGYEIMNHTLEKTGKKLKLLYDSHEYLVGYKYYLRSKKWSNRVKGKFVWDSFVSREKKLLPRVDALITVGESIGQMFKDRLKGKIDPVIIRNMPSDVTWAPAGNKYFHKHFELPTDARIIIHTGNMHFADSRFIMLSKAIEKFENLYAVFIGTSPSIQEKAELKEKLKLSKKILFHPRVKREEITYYCSMADIGLVYTWNPRWKSYWFAVPNKLMDTALAGLPLLTTSQPEFTRFVDSNKNGLYFHGENQEEMENAIEKILADYGEFKSRAEAVKNNYKWEFEVQKLESLYRQLTTEKV